MRTCLERVHQSSDKAVEKLQFALQKHIGNRENVVFFCIGTDRLIGDSLGPLVGTRLKKNGINTVGTIDDPVHAVNMQEKIDKLDKNAFVVAIDACLTVSENVGFICFYDGPLDPGSGVNKKLPLVGDCCIKGMVNIGGFMEYMVLQNTRLSLVMDLADKICNAIELALDKPLPRQVQNSCRPDIIKPQRQYVRGLVLC